MRANVFRHAHVAGELQREFWQAGVELIGLVSLEADAEMIAIAVECLRANGVDKFPYVAQSRRISALPF